MCRISNILSSSDSSYSGIVPISCNSSRDS